MKRKILKCLLLVSGLNFLFNSTAKPESIIIPDEQWYIAKGKNHTVDIGIQEVWKLTEIMNYKRAVTIAVIDGGVDISIPEISTSIWHNADEIPNNGMDDDYNGFVDDIHGWNFTKDNHDVSEYQYSMDELSHGTAIAGIINANPSIGKIYGVVNDKNVKLMILKILYTSDKQNFLPHSNANDLIQAIQYAEENGASICNISLNMDHTDDKLYETISKSKMLFVVSAGNRTGIRRNIDQYPSYPASYNLKNVITVANVKSNGKLNTHSNFGLKSVDIAAPGTDIYCISPQRIYSYRTGTSYATPIVTSLAAIIYMYDDTITSVECKKILCQASYECQHLKSKIKQGRILDCKNVIKKIKERSEDEKNI